MEDEWHVSDSEGEQEREHYTQFMISNLKGLCTTTYQDIHRSHNSSNHTTTGQLYIPKNLNALYTQIENDGFIALQCKGSKRRQDTMKNETNSITVNSCTNHVMYNATSEPQTAESIPSKDLSDPLAVTKNEFDYDEEMMDTMPKVKLPKRKPRSEQDKYRKAKRVGTMEKVINDLNRFERLNAQVMAADRAAQY